MLETLTRRTMLRTLGAGLLTAVVATSASEAQATVAYRCCNLVYSPGSYSYCQSGCNYDWGCATPAGTCRCCERYASCSSSSIVMSAALCN
jgi:hypothetical protein